MQHVQEITIPYILHLADNNLILAQRNSEWCGHGPILEQDIALTNLTLDLLGQARMLYQLAAQRINATNGNEETTEDTLAYLRTEREFSNMLMNELPKGHWGFTVIRMYLYSEFQQLLYKELTQHTDKDIAAIAEKSLKEIKYHIKWSKDWVIRLGDGTEESHQKMQEALDEIWTYTGEMFDAAPFENASLLKSIEGLWLEKVKAKLEEATLTIPEKTFMQKGGKAGIHTEHFGYMLAEMQYLQRTYPNAVW